MADILDLLRPAQDIRYANGTSGLTADTVNAAIDEVEGRVDTVETSLANKAEQLNDLSDVTLSSPTVGQMLVNNGSGQFINNTEIAYNRFASGELSLVNASPTMVLADSAATSNTTINGPTLYFSGGPNWEYDSGYVTALTGGLLRMHSVATLDLETLNGGTGSNITISPRGTTVLSAIDTGITISIATDFGANSASSTFVPTSNEHLVNKLYADGLTSGVAADITDLQTLTGLGDGATNLGTFTGTTISDNASIKGALQELETAVENATSTINNFEWQASALDYVVDNTALPATEVLGARYVLSHDGGAPNAAYDGASAGDIVEFDGSVWVATTPATGTYIAVDDDSSGLYLFGGASWAFKAFEATTASNGLTKVGFDIQLDSAAAGAGLGFAAGVLSVNVDDSGIEIATDTLQLKDLGVSTAKLAATSVTAAKLGSDVAGTGLGGGNGAALTVNFGTGASQAIEGSNLASTANGAGASLVGVEDVAANFTGTTVEAVLAELQTNINSVSAGVNSWTVTTASVTAATGSQHAVDSTSAAVTVTLPASPSAGDSVRVFDAGRAVSTNAITIARNGENIQGVADDVVNSSVEGADVTLVYINGTIGWAITNG